MGQQKSITEFAPELRQQINTSEMLHKVLQKQVGFQQGNYTNRRKV